MAAEKKTVTDENGEAGGESENRVITAASSKQLGWTAATNFTLALHALEADPTRTFSDADEIDA